MLRMATAAVMLGLAVMAVVHVDAAGDIPGTYQTTWVGNTFGGDDYWVQNTIESAHVTPDGTVIAASDWDEAGRCVGLYRDGVPNEALLQQYDGAGGHDAWGWGTASECVTAVGEYIFMVNTEGELLRFRWSPPDINSGEYVDQAESGEANAIDAGGDVLAVARKDGVTEIWSVADLSLNDSFSTGEIRDIAIDPSGESIWFIEDGAIIQRTLDGELLSGEITEAEKPFTLAFAPDGRLIVSDDGPAQQVLFFEMEDEPELTKRFGQEGGLRTGTPGVVEPDKLYGLRGAGLDEDGNLYVALCIGSVHGAGTAIRSFDPGGELRWEVESHAFCDVYGFDPNEDGTLLYGMDEIIKFDPAAEPGEGWRAKAITLDHIEYPDDLRTEGRSGSAFLRHLEGRRLLYTIPQTANRLELFAFEDPPSHIAHHSERLLDDGWALHVDSAGDVWRGDASGGAIERYSFTGWDEDGAPTFNLDDPDTFERPSHYTEVGRVHYIPETDTLYISGYTEEMPAPDWGLMGAILERYDGWTSGAPERRWRIDELPRDDQDLYPKSLYVAGDYVFTVQVRSTDGIPAKVSVFNAEDGDYVGFMGPGPEVGGISGWVDMTHGLQAIKREDGTYLVVVEENYRAKNLVYVWTPPSE